MKVFIVFGQTGEYSDRSDWPVKGFTDEARAEAFEFACSKAAKKWHDEKDARRAAQGFNWAAETEGLKAAVPGDPDFSCDYTGTDYFTVEVEVES